MKKALLFAFAALVIAQSALAVEGLRGRIEKMNRQVASAMLHKDISAFEKLTRPGMTSDFTYIEDGKTMDYDQMVAGMKASFGQLGKITSATSKTTNLKINGGSATASTSHRMVSVSMGPDKKSHTMVFSGTSVDSFRKEDGIWKMSSMKWSDDKMTMDGKPMDMSQMGGGH